MDLRRILILTNRTPYPFKDGGNLAMRAMIEGYHNAGWQVYLLAMNTVRHPVPDAVLKDVYASLYKVETVPVDNRITPVATLINFLFSDEPNHAVRFYNQDFIEKLIQVIKDFDPEVVQLESIYLTTYLPFIKKHSKALTVLRMHNVEYQVWGRLAEETTNVFKRYYLDNLAKRIKKFEEEAWSQYDLLVPITENDAKVVSNEGVTTDMIVVPFGIDTTDKKQAQQESKWALYHLGAMDWLPNAEAMRWFLNDIWPKVHQRHPDMEFYYAGRNMPDEFIKYNPEGVSCMGEVPDADAFITDKKILVVPLRSGGGIRVKILEAMTAGKIIISTGVGMQGIDAQSGVHYLLANDEASFIEKIDWCIANKDEAERIGENAARLVSEKYAQSAIMQHLTAKIENKLSQ